MAKEEGRNVKESNCTITPINNALKKRDQVATKKDLRTKKMLLEIYTKNIKIITLKRGNGE